jgi:hypothetical protein
MTVFWVITLMVEAASTSETLLNVYQTTRCNIAEDSHLHTCCHENLKSHQTEYCLDNDGTEEFFSMLGIKS